MGGRGPVLQIVWGLGPMALQRWWREQSCPVLLIKVVGTPTALGIVRNLIKNPSQRTEDATFCPHAPA